MNSHEHGTTAHSEHDAVMSLLHRWIPAAYVATEDTVWTQSPFVLDNEVVWIPTGVKLTLDGTFTFNGILVEGTLEILDGAHITVDTIVVAPTGSFVAGTEGNPISATFVFPSEEDINAFEDPQLIGRGLISHGSASIFGHPKATHIKVLTDPMAGDTSIEVPDVVASEWTVGDTIVIAGTHYNGWRWSPSQGQVALYPNEDEVRVITGINGTTVSFADPLVYSHEGLRSHLKTSVGNYTRSIVFKSSNINAPIHRRGHVMFMHSPNVNVHYAAFEGLGRTNKEVQSKDATAFMPPMPCEETGEPYCSCNGDCITPETSVKGRYPLHLHHAGFHGEPKLIGNAVWTSPGWGIVHHDCNAFLQYNGERYAAVV